MREWFDNIKIERVHVPLQRCTPIGARWSHHMTAARSRDVAESRILSRCHSAVAYRERGCGLRGLQTWGRRGDPAPPPSSLPRGRTSGFTLDAARRSLCIKCKTYKREFAHEFALICFALTYQRKFVKATVSERERQFSKLLHFFHA